MNAENRAKELLTKAAREMGLSLQNATDAFQSSASGMLLMMLVILKPIEVLDVFRCSRQEDVCPNFIHHFQSRLTVIWNSVSTLRRAEDYASQAMTSFEQARCLVSRIQPLPVPPSTQITELWASSSFILKRLTKVN